ncbi:MAG TPA: glucosaminidase domain-containing protein [Salinivirga sp.]|uniref:glucosaminidase domain-containing protein n=1 Tax=Salinivirga sp. TaxID=1970192 RepID=UPI002B4813E9|nr:glucosaminidase domain-containing protein [Salinivirga sp.]HKK59316.1 glucosaminidase domain-containing protein [Salinivirga sp.]
MYRIIILLLLFVLSLMASAQDISRSDYIEQYSDVAISEMRRTGIPASITMAQAILESSNGNSRLARRANNHFGIKCHSNWSGQTIKHDDDARNECFRKYRNADESFKDHSAFLVNGARYQFLFDYKPTDYKRWARGLKKAGYATNPHYAKKLIELIERYDLHKLDQGVKVQLANKEDDTTQETQGFAPSTGKHPVKERNRVEFTVARPGDTYAALTEEFDKMRWELQKYNDVPDGIEPEPGQIIYLQPKRNRAARDHKHHIVEQGETMWYISQKYAVKLRKLYKKNRMEPGAEPQKGDKIWLRRKKPRNR